MKKTLGIIGLIIAGMAVVIAVTGWIGYQNAMKVKVITPDKNLIILEGGGGNSIVLTSEDGTQALVVDTKMGKTARKVANAVNAKEVTVVNTHLHRDHVGGNMLFPDATLIAGAFTQEQWKALAGASRYPDTVIRPGEEMTITVGSETAHIRNMGAAHTWDDVVVYLEKRKMLLTGDIIFYHLHPALFAQTGSRTASWIRALDSLIVWYPDVETVLPGHGPLSDKLALVDMKDYFTTIAAALGNPEQLTIARKKFKRYHAIPVLTGFDKTVAFMEQERGTPGK